MSLTKQLWLTIILTIALAFSASITVNTITNKRYLEKQLQMKNIDNAVSLALSISQLEKNPVTIDLMLSAQFDNGHYQYISLTDPNGALMVERKNSANQTHVPVWFRQLIQIEAPAGNALIQNGWSQYGTLSLASSTDFAYLDLWHGILLSLAWSFVIAITTALFGTVVLNKILRPLTEMANMAESIGDHYFITIKEPKTSEFKTLAIAMNRLSQKLKDMFHDQTQLLEGLRLEANYDAVTGLKNRKYFINRIVGELSDEESFREGALVVCRINNLYAINELIGSVATDSLLKRIGGELNALIHENTTLIAGRLTGSDIAVYSKQPFDHHLLATQIKNILLKAINNESEANLIIDLSSVSSKISHADQLKGLNILVTASKTTPSPEEADLLSIINLNNVSSYVDKDASEWQILLTTALENKRLKLACFPVISSSGQLIHNESPVRLQLEETGSWIPAAEFIAWAIKLNLITRIDNLVVEFAIRRLAEGNPAIALNVSTGAMCSPGYLENLVKLITAQPQCAQYLWLEMTEDSAFNHLKEFRKFCNTLKPFGVKLGLKHVGAQIAQLSELHDLNLDYIKIDTSLIRDIDRNTGNQALIKGLCLIAHSIGIITIAEGVLTAKESLILPTLGMDGMTGPAIKLNQ
ncbi:MAG: EAL domain-containing protein [Methylococcales bacterium]|nr:EAL domain-containing protein [Methylococcales bacterium]